MRKTANNVHVEGYFYDTDIALKTVQNKNSENFGTEFYNGSISIATDEACTNIVKVSFTYVTALTKQGKPSPTFDNLTKILEGGHSVTAEGKENATLVAINTAFAENNFWSARTNETISSVRLEGGFVNILSSLNADENQRATFETDTLVNAVTRVTPEEEDKEDFVKIRAAVFNFRNDIIPIDLISFTGADYFEDLASDDQPHFLKVFGILDFQNITIKTEEEGAFGGPIVKTRTSRKKDFVVTNANPAEYEVAEDGEADITVIEIKKALQDREVRLAEVKKNYDEYQATKGSTPAFGGATAKPANAAGAKVGDFKF